MCPGLSGQVWVLSSESSVGRTVTARPDWSAYPISTTYQWLRSGHAIAGAVSTSYTITGDDMGHDLVLTATAVDGRGQSASVRSSAVSVPALSGTATLDMQQATVGSVLIARSNWNAPVTESFEWRRSGNLIPGATSAQYTVTQQDLGQVLSVAVIGTIGSASATALAQGLTPRAAVTLRLIAPTRPLKVGRTVRVVGMAESAGTVQGLNVIVKIWRKSPRSWRLHRAATSVVDANRRFVVPLRVPSKGSGAWKAQAFLEPQAGYAGAPSRVRTFTAR